MNHNYYYTLLGTRAGGPGSAVINSCTDSLQFRYSYINTPAGQSGDWYYGSLDPNPTVAWESLPFGGIVTVWASTSTLALGTRLYSDQAKTQEIQAMDGGHQFRIDADLFTYRRGDGIVQITPIPQPAPVAITLSGPQPVSCQLGGPYTQAVWVNRSEWQQVDRVWMDQALSQPYVGGLNWYDADGVAIPSSGTTLQINNCGWVTNFYAC